MSGAHSPDEDTCAGGSRRGGCGQVSGVEGLVRRIEELVAGDPAHVIVGGDLNATPDTSSMRFWTGRTSLDGTSTDHGPTLRIADRRRVLDEPVDGVMASDHYGVAADLEL